MILSCVRTCVSYRPTEFASPLPLTFTRPYVTEIFASLQTVFTVPWPEGFTEYLRWPTWSFFNIDLMDIFGGVNPCAFERPFLDMFVIHMCTLPAMIIVAEAARWFAVMLRCVSAKCAERFDAHTATERMGKFITFVIFFLYPGMSVKIFRVFKCRELDDGEFFLTADMSVRCFEGPWNDYMIVAVVCAVVYVLGIPVATFFVLRRNRPGLYDEEHPDHESLKRKYATLYEQVSAHMTLPYFHFCFF